MPVRRFRHPQRLPLAIPRRPTQIRLIGTDDIRVQPIAVLVLEP